MWMVDFNDETMARELAGAGHQVESRPLQIVLANQPSELPDVGLLRLDGSVAPAVLVRQLLLHGRATGWVLLLPQSRAAAAMEALEAGAADVLIEPLAPGALSVVVVRTARELRNRARLGWIQEHESKEARSVDLIGRSPGITQVLEQLGRIVRRSAHGPPLSVLLTGETGTGKGLLARVLHFTGSRRDGPFVEVNCAALPATLLESELFGHERGAFTDAKVARVGLLEAAHGGTVFLDEVTYLSLEGQAKLLTAIESRRVRRLGSLMERTVDVQVVAASSHDFASRIAQGEFRAELFHRLASLRFELPPLRQRGDDVLMLAEHFLGEVTKSYRLPPKKLGASARAALVACAWPGNVRELFHAVQRAVLASEAEVVEASDLVLPGHAAADAHGEDGSGALKLSLPAGGIALEEVEKAVIVRALAAEKGNVTRAAAWLRISRDTLRSRMEKHGL